MSALESLGRLRLRGLIVVGLVFVAGGAVGGSLVHLLERPAGRHYPPAFTTGRPPGALPPPFERLDLTGEQRERILAILEESRPRTDSILGQTLPRLRAITDSIRREILAVLTPEQREALRRELPFPRGPFRGPPGGGVPPFPDGLGPPFRGGDRTGAYEKDAPSVGAEGRTGADRSGAAPASADTTS